MMLSPKHDRQRVMVLQVETEEQRDALLDLGFKIGQGYLLARPVGAEQMRELFDQERRALQELS